MHLMEAICAIPRRCHYSPYFFPSTRAPLVFVRETPLRTGALQYEPVCSLWEIERPPSSPVQKNMCTRIASNAGFFFFVLWFLDGLQFCRPEATLRNIRRIKPEKNLPSTNCVCMYALAPYKATHACTYTHSVGLLVSTNLSSSGVT